MISPREVAAEGDVVARPLGARHRHVARQLFEGRQRREEREEIQQITELFNELDENGSATLDASEVSALCMRLGVALSHTEVEEAVGEMSGYRQWNLQTLFPGHILEMTGIHY